MAKMVGVMGEVSAEVNGQSACENVTLTTKFDYLICC